MRRLRRAVFFAAGVTLMMAQPSFGQLTDAEFRCELLVSRAGGKFVGSKTKCLTRCFRAFWAGKVPSTDCLPPYGGGTALCIGDTPPPLKGAETRLASAIKKACDPATKPGAACPHCYGGDCSEAGFATDHVDHLEGQVDGIAFGLFCELGANGPEQRCQLATAKLVAKHVAAADKCYAKCRSNARLGLITPESCDPLATDPTTAECLQRVTARTKNAIDDECTDVGALPDCFATNDYPDGETWAFLANHAVDGNQSVVFCGSTTSTSTTSTLPTSSTTTAAPTTSSTSTSSSSSSSTIDPNATTTTSTTLASVARFDFTSTAGTGICGNTYRDLDETIPLKNLLCGRISIGGGLSQVPDNVLPSGATNRFLLTSCAGTTCDIGPTTAGVPPPGIDCTNVGCPFGTPLPISNSGLSLCIANTFSAPPSGTLDTATGDATWSFPLSSRIILTGHPSQPCPICAVAVGDAPCVGSPGSPCTGVCDGSQNQGAACQSTNPNGLSNDCPAPASIAGPGGQRCYRGSSNGATCTTSADCPGGLCSAFIGDIALHSSPLTTGSASLSDAAGLFCPGQTVIQRGAFKTDICLGGANSGKACAVLSDCPGGTSCRAGTLNNYCVGGANDGLGCNTPTTCPAPGICSRAGSLVQTIRATGAPAGALSFGVPQPVGLASVFCVPATLNATTNANAGIPAASAATLTGTITLVP